MAVARPPVPRTAPPAPAIISASRARGGERDGGRGSPHRIVETGWLSRAPPYLAPRRRRPPSSAPRAREGVREMVDAGPLTELLKPDGCRAPPRTSHRAAGARHHQRLARARG